MGILEDADVDAIEMGVADVIEPEQNQEIALNDGDDVKEDANAEAEPAPAPALDITLSSEAMWAQGTEPPDFQLALLFASTWGFQSKLNVKSGSYLISGFVDKAERELKAKGYVPRIGALFGEIQEELRKRKKQLPIYIWNNFTDNIQLYKREEEAEQAKTTIVLDDGGEMEMVPSASPTSPSEG